MATVEKLATVPMIREREDAGDLFVSPAAFEHTQRVAKVFTASALVPDHLRKNVADCILALAIARRMNEDPVSVMQNIYFVSGRAGWLTQYMIARANKAGIFKGPIRWRSSGEGDALQVTAFGTLAETKDEASVTVTMKMAKAEGWTRNSKYNTMPEHMLRWRSATMLIRLYCPEVMMGLPTEDELRDVAAATMRDVTPAEGSKLAAVLADPEPDQPDPDPTTGEIIDTKPAPDAVPPAAEGAASGAAGADNASADPAGNAETGVEPPDWLEYEERICAELQAAAERGLVTKVLTREAQRLTDAPADVAKRVREHAARVQQPKAKRT